MLCRLIIVDDEQHIRNGLKNMIDWQSMGYELAGDFFDAAKAIEYIESNPVDVVLTDIKMKNISGIELAEQLFDRYPEITIVFLSAYSDFEYARKAIKYNVAGYLLKTATIDEITSFMKELVNKVSKKRYLKFDDSLKKDDILFSREQIAEAILEGQYQTPEELSQGLLSVGIPSFEGKMSMVVFCIEAEAGYENWKYGLDGFYNAIKNFFFYFIEQNTYFLCKMQKPAYVVLISEDVKDDNYIKGLEEKISSTLNSDISISVIGWYNGLDEAVQSDVFHVRAQNTVLVKKIIAFIDGNISKVFSVQDVSDALHYSSAHLSRVLKKETGKTLNNYIIEAKMTEAMRLLEEGLYVYEVCEQVGYKSIQYFGKAFKEFTGVTPLEYRTRVREK